VARECIQLASRLGVTLTVYSDERILCAATDEHTDRLLFYREPTPEPVGALEAVVGVENIQKMIFMAPQVRGCMRLGGGRPRARHRTTRGRRAAPPLARRGVHCTLRTSMCAQPLAQSLAWPAASPPGTDTGAPAPGAPLVTAACLPACLPVRSRASMRSGRKWRLQWKERPASPPRSPACWRCAVGPGRAWSGDRATRAILGSCQRVVQWRLGLDQGVGRRPAAGGAHR